MLITAHGGAYGTGRNSKMYFSRIPEYGCDALEVDVRKRGKRLYISHLPALFSKRRLSLEYAFEKAKEYGLYINCDMKECGLLEDVLALARKVGIEDKIFFTVRDLNWKLKDPKIQVCDDIFFFFNKPT